MWQQQQQCIWCAINWRSAGTYFKSICSTASHSLTMPWHAPAPPPSPRLFSLFLVLLATTRLLKRYRKCYRKQNDLMAAIATPWGSSISTRAWAAFHSIYPRPRLQPRSFPRVSISIPEPFWLHSIHCRHWGQHKKKSAKHKRMYGMEARRGWGALRPRDSQQIHSESARKNNGTTRTQTRPIEPLEKYQICIWLLLN